MSSACIGNALRLQFGVDRTPAVSNHSEDWDKCLGAPSKHILQHTIAFERGNQQTSSHLLALKAKYPPINPQKEDNMSPVANVQDNGVVSNGKKPCASNGDVDTDSSADGNLPTPEQYLYPANKVVMGWTSSFRATPGLRNLNGAVCYVNSVVNCLIYTPPLANYLMSGEHSRTCRVQGLCMFCLLEQHFAMMRTSQSPQIAKLAKYPTHICKTFHGYTQEDAHEALRGILHNMQQAFLHSYKGTIKKCRFLEETTVVNQIFGGILRSQVKCMRCNGVSNKFDPFMDLSLDIKSSTNESTVVSALHKYVTPDILNDANAYRCERCKDLVTAEKKFTIHRESNILTIQLKRFGHTMSSTKWSRLCRYPEYLNLRPYMSDTSGPPINYQLYGVINHYGYSCNSGHYICYVRSPSEGWVRYNDEKRDFVKPFQVLNNSDAYILFYKKSTASPMLNKPSNTMGGTTNSKHMTHKYQSSSTPVANGNVKSLKNPYGNMNGTREKVHFALRHPIANTSQPSLKGTAENASKKRLVIKIKNKSKIMYHSVTSVPSATATVTSNTKPVASSSMSGSCTVTSATVGNNSIHASPSQENRPIPAASATNSYNTGTPVSNGGRNQLVPYTNESSDESDHDSSKEAKRQCLLVPKSPLLNGHASPKRRKSMECESGKSPKRRKSMDRDLHKNPRHGLHPMYSADKYRHISKSAPSSPVRKAQTFEPMFNDKLSTTVKVPGHSARLDGVKDSPKLPKTQLGPKANKSSIVGVKGDHRYTKSLDDFWGLSPEKPANSVNETNESFSNVTHDVEIPKPKHIVDRRSSDHVKSPKYWEGSDKVQNPKKRRMSADHEHERHHSGEDVLHNQKNLQPKQSSSMVSNLNSSSQSSHKQEDIDDLLYDHALAPVTNGFATTSDETGSERSPKKKKKHKKHKRHKDKSLSDTTLSSPGYQEDEKQPTVVWVEKTKETLNKTPATVITPAISNGNAAKLSSTKYDGMYTSKNVEILQALKKTPSIGSGSNSFWDDEDKSAPQTPSGATSSSSKLESWKERYEENLDSGRTKKVKHHDRHQQHSSNSNRNVFQVFQNRVNKYGEDPHRSSGYSNSDSSRHPTSTPTPHHYKSSHYGGWGGKHHSDGGGGGHGYSHHKSHHHHHHHRHNSHHYHGSGKNRQSPYSRPPKYR